MSTYVTILGVVHDPPFLFLVGFRSEPTAYGENDDALKGPAIILQALFVRVQGPNIMASVNTPPQIEDHELSPSPGTYTLKPSAQLLKPPNTELLKS